MKIIGLTRLTIPDLQVSDISGLTFEITLKQGEIYSISQFCRYDPALLGPNADSLLLRDRVGTLHLQVSHFRQEVNSLWFQGEAIWEIDESQLNHSLNQPFVARHSSQYDHVFHLTECCEFEIDAPQVTAGLYLLPNEEPLPLEHYFNRRACFRHRFGLDYETGAWLASDSAWILPMIQSAAQTTPQYVELVTDHLRSLRGLQALRNLTDELKELVQQHEQRNNQADIAHLKQWLKHPVVQKLNQQIVAIYGQSLKDFLGLL